MKIELTPRPPPPPAEPRPGTARGTSWVMRKDRAEVGGRACDLFTCGSATCVLPVRSAEERGTGLWHGDFARRVSPSAGVCSQFVIAGAPHTAPRGPGSRRPLRKRGRATDLAVCCRPTVRRPSGDDENCAPETSKIFCPTSSSQAATLRPRPPSRKPAARPDRHDGVLPALTGAAHGSAPMVPVPPTVGDGAGPPSAQRRRRPQTTPCLPDPSLAGSCGVPLPLTAPPLSGRWHPSLADGARILELGSGTGVCGLMVARGTSAREVVLTDGDAVMVERLADAIESNAALDGGFGGTAVSAQRLLWGQDTLAERFDIIVCTDCVYNRGLHQVLARAIRDHLAPHGVCILVASPREGSLETFLPVARGTLVVSEPASAREGIILPTFASMKCLPRLFLIRHALPELIARPVNPLASAERAQGGEISARDISSRGAKRETVLPRSDFGWPEPPVRPAGTAGTGGGETRGALSAAEIASVVDRLYSTPVRRRAASFNTIESDGPKKRRKRAAKKRTKTKAGPVGGTTRTTTTTTTTITGAKARKKGGGKRKRKKRTNP
jgi:SAM-dependent methyltransferase